MEKKNDSSQSLTRPHFLFVTFPAQGHINPSLELAKRLAGTITGVRVTFAAPKSTYNDRMFSRENVPETLIFATYSDGHDEDFKSSTSSDQSREDAAVQYLSATRRPRALMDGEDTPAKRVKELLMLRGWLVFTAAVIEIVSLMSCCGITDMSFEVLWTGDADLTHSLDAW
ncbi:hypothetical protein F2Q70_00039463 [Brassica cretica]|uniref:Uncharacterized protein n=1 Tax=Brassica cretica TaxID=69181 RepID=A0A8S9KB97_BRACR|nr:hypothetical protein F2Q70_00039463 [Brassica cretica]